MGQWCIVDSCKESVASQQRVSSPQSPPRLLRKDIQLVSHTRPNKRAVARFLATVFLIPVIALQGCSKAPAPEVSQAPKATAGAHKVLVKEHPKKKAKAKTVVVKKKANKPNPVKKHKAVSKKAVKSQQGHSKARSKCKSWEDWTQACGKNQRIGKAQASKRGWTGRQWVCLKKLWYHESGWSIRSGSPNGGSFGIPQSLPGSKMASAGSDWRTNAATQIKWGLGYIKSRYGSPCGAFAHWQSHHWY